MRSKLSLSFLVFAALLLPSSGWANGSAYFNHEINWSHTSPLYYSVAGGPAHTCGDLWAKRNAGAWQKEAGGWLCTDSFGNATKGPWYFNNQAGDETAFVYIKWPDGTQTNTAKHIWDKTAPTVRITSPAGTWGSPSAFYGTATDASWGAGFNSNWARCHMAFREHNIDYWAPGTSTYSSSFTAVPCTLSGMPSLSVSWNASQIPPGSAHFAGRCYTWEVWVYDGGYWGYASRAFCL